VGKTVFVVAVMTALGRLAIGLNAQPADKVVPVHEEPRHRLIFDSPGTRILDVNIPPGDTTLFHTHSDPILYVNMSASQTRSQTLGGEWLGGDTAQAANLKPQPSPGRMTSTTSYAKQPLTHRVHNVGQTLFRLIGITNSSAGDESAAASEGFDAAPEMGNRWFRGYRWTLDATAVTHRHGNPVAIVLISGRVMAQAATQTSTLSAPGAFAWYEGNDPHSLRAIDSVGEVVEVEVRRPRGVQ
jgi:quercetin dioxygenase-like cupin family protein